MTKTTKTPAATPRVTIELVGDDFFYGVPEVARATFRVIVWDRRPGAYCDHIVDVAEAEGIPGQCNAVNVLRKFIRANGGPDQKPSAFKAVRDAAAERHANE
jgi:hypothetical protein